MSKYPYLTLHQLIAWLKSVVLLRRNGAKYPGKPTSMKYWGDCKNEIARITKTGGMVICFGWNSMGIGKNRDFRMDEILLVPHGGSKNDTIVTVEVKGDSNVTAK
jgi:hypothetical protein